jgi:acyl-CoA synthetase (AMP-forming)/AMP-acid ligase II
MGVSEMPEAERFAAQAGGITLAGVFHRSARIFGERVAVVSEDGVELTYRELAARANRLANALTGLGLARGDRLAVLSEPHAGYIETYVAAAYLGITVVALNTRLHPGELRACVDGARPRLLLVSGAMAPTADALRDSPFVERVFCFDGLVPGAESYPQLLDGGSSADPDVAAEPEDIHNILYTSGTTGVPKGAMISQRAAATRALRIVEYFGLGPDDGFVGWPPLYHCAGDESLYATLMSGGKFVPISKAEPERMFRLIERERLTWTPLIPGLITEFLDHPKRTAHDLTSLRFSVGYANMMPQVVKELTAATGMIYYDAFGQTESSYLVA